MNQSSSDQIFMAHAIQLAKKGRYTTHPNPRVGCVIVKNNTIIGEGYHQRAGYAHAEINAINAATESLQHATAYVTLEPCSHTGKTPPCADALVETGINRVVIAMQDPNPEVAGEGIKKLQAAGIEVVSGVLETEARDLNPGFIKRMEQGLPWIRVKLAMSLDGRTAMQSGESQWITGDAARTDVQRLRASADAILTGSGTAIKDDPSLNVRISAAELGFEGYVHQPLRVVLDSRLQIPLTAKMFSLDGETLIYTCADELQKTKQLETAGARIEIIESDSNHLPLTAVLKDLAKKHINEVHVEAGATLSGALLQQQLVNELVIYMAPSILGSDARGLLELPGLDKIKDKTDLNVQDIRAVGNDWRISAYPLYQ
jgi:diaminohydroxyphosphoribosylaminopyrimidine deaminase/5-amino-6-(5-phosphoribosylamino)uracil reductase